jgi:hypothetical protein
MSNDRLNGLEERLHAYRLSVLRIKAGQKFILRMLSKEVKGFFIHYVGKRSEYCAGKDCSCQHQRIKRQWKGYVAAEQYDQSGNLWLPTVLEVTEYLELDFRDIYQRGQVWEVSRMAEKPRQTNPVTGKLLEVRNPDTFPQPHQIYDSLLHLYHVTTLDMSQKNPLPARTYVHPSIGAAPKGFEPEEALSAEQVAENLRKMREKLHERNGAKKL